MSPASSCWWTCVRGPMGTHEARGVVGRALDWESEDLSSRPASATSCRGTWGESVLLPEPQLSHLHNMGGSCTSLWAVSLTKGVTRGILLLLVMFSQVHALCFLGTTAGSSEPTSTLHTAAGGNRLNGLPRAHVLCPVPLHSVSQPTGRSQVRTWARQA